MNVEEVVREALQRTGSERHVDVSALHASTKAAISLRRGHRDDRSMGTGWRPMAVVAAAVVGLIGAVAFIPGFDQDDSADEPSTSARGEVDDTFTCPAQRVTRFGPGNDDDSFLPELTAGLKPAGEATGAPLWEAERVGGTAVLRLGNSDGTLASVIRFKHTPKGFRTLRVTKCSNEDPGAASSPELIVEGLPPPAPDAFDEDNLPPGSLRVLDRLTYDVRGLARRHTMWAEPCGKTICLIAGTKNSHTISRLPGRAPAPVDQTGQLASPDDTVGQDLGLRLIAVYDRHDTVAAVSWDSDEGAITWVEPLDDEGRPGQLFVILAPDAKLAVVTLHPRTGEGRNYERDDFID